MHKRSYTILDPPPATPGWHDGQYPCAAFTCTHLPCGLVHLTDALHHHTASLQTFHTLFIELVRLLSPKPARRRKGQDG